MINTVTDPAYSELLDLLPQTAPFRFVDRVIEISDRHVVAMYRFRGDEFFYLGHFHDHAVTPGVILLETMAQGGVVLQALYLLSKSGLSRHAARRTVLTDVQGEIHRPVLPPQSVIIRGELMIWRASKIRSKVRMFNETNDLIATATIAGIGVAIA